MAESDIGDDSKTVQAFISGCAWELPNENNEPYFLPCIHALCKDCIDKNDCNEDQRHKEASRPTYKCNICSLEIQHQTQVSFATELSEMIPQVIQMWMKVFDSKISCGKCGSWLFPLAHYCEQCRWCLCLPCKQRHEYWHKVSLLHTHVLNKKFDHGHWNHERPLEIHCVGCAKSACIACFIENDRTASAVINSDYEKVKRRMSLLSKNLGERIEQLYHEKQGIQHEEEFLAKEIDRQVNDVKNRLDKWGKDLKEQIKLNYTSKSAALDSEMKKAKQSWATLEDKLLDLPILKGKEIVDYLCKQKYFLCLKNEYNECTQLDSPTSHLCFRVSNILHLSNEDIFGTLQESQDKPPLDADKCDDSTRSLVENICSKVVKREIFEEILSISQNQHSFGATMPFEAVETTITKTVDEYHDMMIETKRELERVTSAINREESNNDAFAASLSILENNIVRELKSFKFFCGMITSIYGTKNLSSSLQAKIANCATQVDEQRMMLQRVMEQLKQPAPTGLNRNRGQSSAQCPPKVAPLVNLGNTCFMNAVVQALFRTKTFARLLRTRFSKDGDKKQDPTLAESFVELSSQMQSGTNDVYPTELYTTLNAVLKKFTDSNQHDSHDFFIQFLNKVRQEERDELSRLCSTNRAGPMLDPKTMLTAVDEVFGGHTLTVYICLQCKNPYHICEPFLSVSLPTCEQATQCSSRPDEGSRKKYKGWEFKPSTAYQTAIAHALKPFSGVNSGQPGSSKKSVTSSLERYTRLEHIDNEYLCTECNQRAGAKKQPIMTPAKKRTLIYTPPAVLTVHLKRFKLTKTSGNSGFTKIDDHINFEHFLDIAPFCSSGCLNVDHSQGNIWYMLYAVVVHSGSLSSGHYVAYILARDSETDIADFLQKRFLGRNERFSEEEMIKSIERLPEVQKEFREKPKELTGTWYRISDSQCDVAKGCYPGSSYDEVLEQNAYMLFYERMLSAP